MHCANAGSTLLHAWGGCFRRSAMGLPQLPQSPELGPLVLQTLEVTRALWHHQVQCTAQAWIASEQLQWYSLQLGGCLSACSAAATTDAVQSCICICTALHV
jgi:hypothetical protein